ncbi:UDP-3-O-acylglucosamine N-acyltransferase [Botrimarina colliarenosi]|uniref:UDP-3-O-acylglucosamine N-acyltransferase n=1 Tax=Botrimarina colliarenosi TaxID=2528001 RepID=A0A5C6A7E4_9BACT|nr:UDP-3-O-(3-hydroxymyristoyl)glucosamine N-acyltransferase [Botrimarina colliarenosi]TWT95356.1 UDP-3-O-acylglucosamine N-acyltransferase [Botrimarina colliarenosi]
MAATITLGELAAMVGGETHGDPTTLIHNAWPPQDCDAHAITLVDSAEKLPKLEGCPAAALVAPLDATNPGRPAILVANVHAAFAAIVTHFRPRRERRVTGIHATAVVPPSTHLGSEVSIGAGAVIGEDVVLGDRVTIGANAVIGDDCRVGAGTLVGTRVTLYEGTLVGERCRLHSGVVLGADGFGYRQVEGRHIPVPQLGSVEIGDDVEIGANTTIDRGVYGPTKIGDGTKIDNLVQIGHNCRIGRHNLLCSQVGIAGSTSTGDYVVMAGQVGVRDHVHIGDGAILSAMAGVSNDVPAGEIMLGAPATPLREQKLKFAAIAKLPQLRKEFRELRREVTELQKRLAERPNSSLDRAA